MNKARVVEKTPADLNALLGVGRGAGSPMNTLRRVPSREIDIEAVEVASAPKVWLPGWLFLPRGNQRGKPAVLVIDAGGRNRHWGEGELYQSLANRGYPICSADVRGSGDLAPEFGRGDPGYTRPHQNEENYAWGSLILGRP